MDLLEYRHGNRPTTRPSTSHFSRRDEMTHHYASSGSHANDIDVERTRLLISREYMLAANRLSRPPPWHSGGRRWAVSAYTVAMAEREARIVAAAGNSPGSIPASFWSLQRSNPARPGGQRRAKTASSASYAERTRFKPEAYRAEPCNKCDTMRQCLNNEFMKNFDTEQLRHVDTTTRNTLPTQQVISAERRAIQGGERAHSAIRWEAVKNLKKKTVKFYSAPNTSEGPRLESTSIFDVVNTATKTTTASDTIMNVEDDET